MILRSLIELIAVMIFANLRFFIIALMLDYLALSLTIKRQHCLIFGTCWANFLFKTFFIHNLKKTKASVIKI